MSRRRFATALSTVALSLGAVFAAPAPAAAAAPADKPQVLSNWTQTSTSSYHAWLSARDNQSAFTSYGFDWSTDYCTSSPDNPFGFPFDTSCARHDFGYRNYRAQGTFEANKARLDSAFYADMQRVCDRYSGATGTSCDQLARTYYQAVRAFG